MVIATSVIQIEKSALEWSATDEADFSIITRGQTFFTGARPNRPLGIAARARMTTANITICV
jgi:hypothetical protein